MAQTPSSVEELAKDSSFIAFVLGESQDDTLLWQQKIEENPEYEELVKQASIIVKLMHQSKSKLPHRKINKLWDDLSSQID